MKFFKCNECGNVIYLINEKCDNLTCCGKKMHELISRGTDASYEKHVPVYYEDQGVFFVKVGEIDHPMDENHYIEFIVVQTTRNVYFKRLKPNSKPEASFVLNDEDLVDVYAYCNLHGLWNS